MQLEFCKSSKFQLYTIEVKEDSNRKLGGYRLLTSEEYFLRSS